MHIIKLEWLRKQKGDYAEALENYYESLYLDEDQYDRSYTLYNIGLIYGKKENYPRALEYYHQAVALNSNLPQALNNIAAIYHSKVLALEMASQDMILQWKFRRI